MDHDVGQPPQATFEVDYEVEPADPGALLEALAEILAGDQGARNEG